jgi:hypothetical protein
MQKELNQSQQEKVQLGDQLKAARTHDKENQETQNHRHEADEFERNLKQVQADSQTEKNHKEQNLQKYRDTYQSFEQQIVHSQAQLDKENLERADLQDRNN